MPQIDRTAFRLTPDLRFLFAYGAHEEAFAKLRNALGSGERLLLMTGPFGVGKTLLLRRLEASLARDGIPAAYAAYPQLDFAELLTSVIGHHDTATADAERPPRTDGIVLVDDADRCSNALLQNLQDWIVSSRDGPRALQFVLAGSPGLAGRLALDFPTLNATVGAHAQIEPLSDTEAGAYIRHRLDVSGRADIALQADARDAVVHYSRGIPRLINHACARALLLAGPDQPLISPEIAREAIEDYIANASFGQAPGAALPPLPPASTEAQDIAPPGRTLEAAVPPQAVGPAEPTEPPRIEATPEPPPVASDLVQPEPAPEPAPVDPAPPPAQRPAASADGPVEAPTADAAPEANIEIPPLPPPDRPRSAAAAPPARKPLRPNRLLRSIRSGGKDPRLDLAGAALPKFAGFRQRKAAGRDRPPTPPTQPHAAPPARRRAALQRLLVVAGLLAAVGAALYVERTPAALATALSHGEGLNRHLGEAWRTAVAHASMLMDEIRRIAETLKI